MQYDVERGLAQTGVFLCIDLNNPNKKQYKNSGVEKGCKKVDLPWITMVPARIPSQTSAGLAIGMSRLEARKVQGKPLAIRRVETRNGVVERWTYANGKVLTFSNGSLEMIEN